MSIWILDFGEFLKSVQQSFGRENVEFTAVVGQNLVAIIGRDMDHHWIIHSVICTKGHLFVAAVCAAKAGVQQMRHRMIPSGFQDVVEIDHFALDVLRVK